MGQVDFCLIMLYRWNGWSWFDPQPEWYFFCYLTGSGNLAHNSHYKFLCQIGLS